jgi:tRNA (adenine57-N1/adenine58-N1)-methyltransferase
VFSINKGDRAPTWLIALAPTPTLWSHTLKHRTQILYPTDIAMVLSELRVRPGSLVLESGTGSGSLSSAFARSVAPTGHLHTFEFNSERVRQARNDFNLLGFGPDLLTVYWRDICAQGFPIVGNGGEVDAIFLDLPTPFADPLLKSLVANLKPRHGRVCSFSPCIEQVQKMCVALAQHGFQELITIECLLCAYDVREDSASIPDLGFGDDSADASVGSKRKSPETDEKTEAEQGKKNVVAVAPTFIGTSKSKVVTVPVQLARGHTGFLTFATYFPLQAAPAATE